MPKKETRTIVVGSYPAIDGNSYEITYDKVMHWHQASLHGDFIMGQTYDEVWKQIDKTLKLEAQWNWIPFIHVTTTMASDTFGATRLMRMYTARINGCWVFTQWDVPPDQRGTSHQYYRFNNDHYFDGVFQIPSRSHSFGDRASIMLPYSDETWDALTQKLQAVSQAHEEYRTLAESICGEIVFPEPTSTELCCGTGLTQYEGYTGTAIDQVIKDLGVDLGRDISSARKETT